MSLKSWPLTGVSGRFYFLFFFYFLKSSTLCRSQRKDIVYLKSTNKWCAQQPSWAFEGKATEFNRSLVNMHAMTILFFFFRFWGDLRSGTFCHKWCTVERIAKLNVIFPNERKLKGKNLEKTVGGRGGGEGVGCKYFVPRKRKWMQPSR